VLDQLELNMRRHPRFDHRTVIIHFAISNPDQVARIHRLGAIVSANPYYPVALADNYRSNGLDPERADVMARIGDVGRAGIPYSLHSDMPMAPGQPLFLMWSAVNRVTLEGNVRGPEQRVSQLDALKAVTIEAAYSFQMEREVGSIESGKLASFTILADNPLTVDPMKIKDIEVWGTVQEGRVLPVKPLTGSKAQARLDLEAPVLATAVAADRHDHARAGDVCTIARRFEAVIAAAEQNRGNKGVMGWE
jgi:predicted amidohydrolase YtcJ